MDRTFDRILLARHFALSLGAVVSYVFRTELNVGYMAMWVIGVCALLNFVVYLVQSRFGARRPSMLVSSIVGVVGWVLLIRYTTGVDSPFIAGLFLEVVLSALALQLQGIVVVTVLSVTMLASSQLYFWGSATPVGQLTLQCGFLIALGLATYQVTWRWTLRQEAYRETQVELGQRLDLLTRELEDERLVAQLGGNVARLAHGLKNTVHSLRGFVSLIEPRIDHKQGGTGALDGLRSAIDDLEALAQLTLGSAHVPRESTAEPRALRDSAGEHLRLSVEMHDGEAAATLRPERMESMPAGIAPALQQMVATHPEVGWETKSDGARPVLTLPETSFTETLVILLRNAVEAMDGDGSGLVESWVEDGRLNVAISDAGVGFDDVDVSKIFKPGYTTKSEGSGYGLFLARRIIEEDGGTIALKSRAGGGARVELTLPVAGAPSAEATG
jgi:signal transduction histidine kinase